MHHHSVAMTLLARFLTFLAYTSLATAAIRINTKELVKSCLTLNPTTTTMHKVHLVNSFNLQKCCPIGWHLNLAVQSRGVPCIEGDQSFEIDMVFITDRESMIYEPLELLNHTIQVSTLYKRRYVPFIDTDGHLILDQNGVLAEMVANCTDIIWHDESCVDYDSWKGQVVGLWKTAFFNVEIYVLLPCNAISIVCMICVILVYVAVPALNDLMGKALIGLVCCLLLTYTFTILQYTYALEDLTIVENMEDISYLCCSIWFVLMWGNICVNAWYYLPRNDKMGRQLERRILIGTLAFCVVFFAILLAVAKYTTGFPSHNVSLIVILVILLLCVATCFASWQGFKHLTRLQKPTYSAERNLEAYSEDQTRLPTFNSADINKFQTMCTSTSYILMYAILCFSFKCVRQRVPDAYDMFTALAGTFIFLVFVCWRRTQTIIKDSWRDRNGRVENLDTTNMSELLPMNNIE